MSFGNSYDCVCQDRNGNTITNSVCRQQHNNRDCCRTVNLYNTDCATTDAYLYNNPDSSIYFSFFDSCYFRKSLKLYFFLESRPFCRR